MADPTPTPTPPKTVPPLAQGLLANLRFDVLSGFLVFLIAMPLCLAIAKASNYPPVCGIWTAVIGGVVTCFLSNASLTIKGPAAGLIVIVAGAVTELGREFVPALPPELLASLTAEGKTEAQLAQILEFRQLDAGHELAMGVGVVAAVIQVLFGVFKAGKLGDAFPLAAVHGMLAAIGIIIIAKQMYGVFGIAPTKGAGPLTLIAEFPRKLPEYDPIIACIGVTSLIILFGWGYLPWKAVRKVPPQLVALLVAVPMGLAFDLSHEHAYTFGDGVMTSYDAPHVVGPKFLVDVPHVLQEPEQAFFRPNFAGVLTATGVKYIVMFSLIASLESLLSAKAIDMLDPWKRKTDMNRDLLACGVANTAASVIGGLPMISEIVRSKANIDNGGRTKYANFFHALFLLGFVLAVPSLINKIPLAALGAMLVFTGTRLAHPREFVHTFHIGLDQLAVFCLTIIVTLAEDLLLGIFAGIALELALHLVNGTPFRRVFSADTLTMAENDATVTVAVRGAAVFSNWLSLKPKLLKAAEGKDLVIDFRDARMVDHTVMEKVHELGEDFRLHRHAVTVVGLEGHTSFSAHPYAARRAGRKTTTETPALPTGV